MEIELEDNIPIIFLIAAVGCFFGMVLTWSSVLVSALLWTAGFILTIGGLLYSKVKE